MEINGHQLPPGLEFMAERIKRCAAGLVNVEDLSVGDVVYCSMDREPRHRVEVVALRHPTRQECAKIVGLSQSHIVADIRSPSGHVGMCGGALYR
jgi:hypothetical protein